ncbi:hypothetical protein GLOTRDRAFT_40766 [Gloeophyllum trabeum ATCC 11539]|uniref:BTB domain-containing protein n=1 Tax=Gloeophyllum trabeum (strain ATCC 11539 / FP-39264 / Madison 617) TaxID=670483 RepID=S7Q7V8_GLOTA|nr:uncharacterized protein GLOTRDRAFT_40766 [Gloeophyllum trabeum ATCC 11539]EPQ55617.1 hypothetical protein GLOTRDRAFT_40766 [Gloeophyllum trabeum ATCC 11539]
MPSPYWFEDGDIVLAVEAHTCKIHRAKLTCSLIFSDMLDLPQPVETDSVDGCPSVTLYDSWKDWLVVLEWLYAHDAFRNKPIVFDALVGALRISTKYEISELRDWAVAELCARWPRELELLSTQSLPHAAGKSARQALHARPDGYRSEAINLARECDVPEILPGAFYALAVQKWHCSAEGGRSHVVLSSADLRRIIAGRERLQDYLVQIVIDPLGRSDEPPPPFCAGCVPPLERYWREKLAPDPTSPYGSWLLRDLLAMAKEDGPIPMLQTVCANCSFLHYSLLYDRMRTLKQSIPRLFQL